MKHIQTNQLTITPLAQAQRVNTESGRCGESALARNVREQPDALQVTGHPATVGTIGAGETLVLVADGHYVTLTGGHIAIDGVAVAPVPAGFAGAFAIGPWIVLTGSEGFTYLLSRDGTWAAVDAADAVPQLTLLAGYTTETAPLAPYPFENTYGQWRAPLAANDVAGLRSLLVNAWKTLRDNAEAAGRHTGPLLARYAVRLADDSYLWVSAPVRLGDDTMQNLAYVAAAVTLDGNDRFTGTQASALTMRSFTLQVQVDRQIAPEWQSQVKAVDVFVTDAASLVSDSMALDYRCMTVDAGSRTYTLEMALEGRSPAAVSALLAASSWHLAATSTSVDQLTPGSFVAPATAVTLTGAQLAGIEQSMLLRSAVCAVTTGGRLYWCQADGTVCVTAPGNPLVLAHSRRLLGVIPRAMAAVPRPLYSGGLGRYSVYVFTTDGIYTLPQTTAGTLGEARLIHRSVIAPGIAPAEAGHDIYYVSRHGHLCRLAGTRVTVTLLRCGATALAWCPAYDELWMLRQSALPLVLMPGGRTSERTVDVTQLYADPCNALAVDLAGNVLDLEQESDAVMAVQWVTHPVTLSTFMGTVPCRLVWHLSSPQAMLSLRLMGLRGLGMDALTMSRVTLDGAADRPLAVPLSLQGCRDISLRLEGTARSGSLICPVTIQTLTIDRPT